jgi:hypothetical protein
MAAAQDAPDIAPAPTPKTKVAKRTRPHTASSIGAADSDEEIPLLQRAHRALTDNPELALALATRHTRRFPTSSLDQERGLIAIQALVALGRRTEARREAEQLPSNIQHRPILGAFRLPWASNMTFIRTTSFAHSRLEATS